ncbi:MAG: urease accessory protein UreF [Rhodocyclaceae bacterium]|nr:urease accessory protein UreF [Rhodocyclaceae bacterium]
MAKVEARESTIIFRPNEQRHLMLARLLQLASPALPVGAYSYSQGLEWAVEAGTVIDEATALVWIGDQLELNVGRYEAPMLLRMMAAWRECMSVGADETNAEAETTMQQGGRAKDALRAVACGNTPLSQLDAEYLASRESAELRAETLQMGYSMTRLLNELGDFPQALLDELHRDENQVSGSYLYVWTCAAAHWQIPDQDALTAWLWSWAENQTMAALKAVPLGQAGGQRLLQEIGRCLPAIVEQAMAMDEADISNFAPGFAIACCRHETQYTRIFRS